MEKARQHSPLICGVVPPHAFAANLLASASVTSESDVSFTSCVTGSQQLISLSYSITLPWYMVSSLQD